MFTDTDEVPLRQVLDAIKQKEGGAQASIDLRKASREDLFAYMGEVLPDFDRDRVHVSDIKKLISWYNLLVASGMTDFSAEEEVGSTAEDGAAGAAQS